MNSYTSENKPHALLTTPDQPLSTPLIIDCELLSCSPNLLELTLDNSSQVDSDVSSHLSPVDAKYDDVSDLLSEKEDSISLTKLKI
ncbi:hypothetical protein NPIL_381831 [Nephila pilipes]|uniref:Uncharacterized protein n=1 Tax=Nephila pilipes TaxID=299642 RepID=A0A8X6P0F0_NEPPI|nr:hypothetical protein NPIL_381831 [Nephila pilipes]